MISGAVGTSQVMHLLILLPFLVAGGVLLLRETRRRCWNVAARAERFWPLFLCSAERRRPILHKKRTYVLEIQAKSVIP